MGSGFPVHFLVICVLLLLPWDTVFMPNRLAACTSGSTAFQGSGRIFPIAQPRSNVRTLLKSFGVCVWYRSHVAAYLACDLQALLLTGLARTAAHPCIVGGLQDTYADFLRTQVSSARAAAGVAAKRPLLPDCADDHLVTAVQ